MSYLVNRKILEKACLHTVFRWIESEHDYHQLFSTGSAGYKANTVKFQKAFYRFTNDYSVRRTVQGAGKEVTYELLKWFVDRDFIELAKKRDANIDDFSFYKERKITSLTSKFATLINPEGYTMYDGNAKHGLNKMNKRKKYYEDYQSLREDYKVLRVSIKKELKGPKEDFYLKSVLSRFGNYSSTMTESIFINRTTDKYLWVMINES